MISAEDLAKMQTTQEGALPDLITIEREVQTTTTIGSAKHASWSTIATDVPCRFTPMQMLEVLGEQSRPVEVSKWVGRVPLGTDIKDRDRITITTQSNQVLRVERIKEPRSWNTVLTIEAEEAR